MNRKQLIIMEKYSIYEFSVQENIDKKEATIIRCFFLLLPIIRLLVVLDSNLLGNFWKRS